MNKLKIISKLNPEDKPMNKTHFFKWLEDNYQDCRIDNILNYLESEFNFNKGIDVVSSDNIKSLQYIYDCYYQSIERYKLKNINDLSELLINIKFYDSVQESQKISKRIVVKNEDNFINNSMLTSNHKIINYDITDKLKNCLNECFKNHLNLSGYLQLVIRKDNSMSLYYQYNYIIGSIYIANIKNGAPSEFIK